MRDEEKNIARCLESMQGQVDEIIVVDTGSSDTSVEIARRFTTKVYDYAWQNDFAAAKNYALSKAQGDWVVFIDADEFFSSQTRSNLHEVLDFCADNWDFLQFYRANIDADRQDEPRDAEFMLRAFRRDPLLRFVGRIHEVPEFADGRQVRIVNIPMEKLLLYHTGYSTGLARKKCERNLEVLLLEQKQQPERNLLCRYLADAYFGVDDYAMAVKYAKLAIEERRPPLVEASRPYHVLLDSLRAMDAPEEQIVEALRLGMRDFPKLPDFWAEYGGVFYSRGKYHKALDYFRKAEKLQMSYHDPREFSLLTQSMPKMYELMADCYEHRGDIRRAAAYRAKSIGETSK